MKSQALCLVFFYYEISLTFFFMGLLNNYA